MQKQLSKLSFTIYIPYEFENDPELLFFANKDVTLNNETPFIPMPVISYSGEQIWVYKKITIQTQLVDGYYFFKFKEFKRKSQILILVNNDDQKLSSINSIEQGILNNQEIVQKIFISNPGTLSVTYQSCKDLFSVESNLIQNDSP